MKVFGMRLLKKPCEDDKPDPRLCALDDALKKNEETRGRLLKRFDTLDELERERKVAGGR